MPFPVPGRIAEALRRSTVRISYEGSGRGSQAFGGSGSGVVIGPELVITNAHVVIGSNPQVESWEGRTIRASVEKVNRRRDLALLRVPKLEAPSAVLGDSETVKPGQAVFAVGNPMGFTGAVSSGVIHSAGPAGPAGRGGLMSMPWIRSDLRLAPGNSGGPLATFQCELIGINTMIAAGGVAFAVPSRAVQRFLRAGQRGSLGVVLRPVETQEQAGLLILELVPGGAAEAASLLPGDILVASHGSRLATPEDLEAAMDGAADSLLPLDFLRGGGRAAVRHVAVKLKAEPVRSAA